MVLWRKNANGQSRANFSEPGLKLKKFEPNLLRKSLSKGNVKIGVYDYSTVFLDFTNEHDFKSVWYRRSVEIEGQVMRLEKWTPDFKSDVVCHAPTSGSVIGAQSR